MEGLTSLFEQPVNMSTTLAELVAAGDIKALRAAASEAADHINAPGQMSVDDANTYMAEIKNLFPGVDGVQVEIALAMWAALHDVGGTQDFSSKDPIVAGSISVPATRVFGGVVPVDNRGLPRKFCSTRFEGVVGALLNADPTFRQKLTPKAIRAGLQPGDELKVVSYVRGVTPATVSGGGDRQMAKDMLLNRRPATQGAQMNLSSPVVREIAAPQSNQGKPSTTSHALF